MSAGAIVAIIVAVALVILVIGALTTMRRRQLRQRFGQEYDRVAGDMRSHRKADAELAARERRVPGRHHPPPAGETPGQDRAAVSANPTELVGRPAEA